MGYIDDLVKEITEKFKANEDRLDEIAKEMAVLDDEQDAILRALDALGAPRSINGPARPPRMRDGSLESLVLGVLQSDERVKEMKYLPNVVDRVLLVLEGEYTTQQVSDTIWRLVNKQKIESWWMKSPKGRSVRPPTPSEPVADPPEASSPSQDAPPSAPPEEQDWRELCATQVQGTMAFEGADRHPDLK